MQRRFEPTALAPGPMGREPTLGWSATLPALGLDGADLVSGGPALLALAGGDLAAIDAATGAVSWQVRCDESLFPSLGAVAIGPTVVVSITGPERDMVCGVELSDGHRKWCRHGSLLSDSLTGLTVAVARYDDDVHIASVDVHTGKSVWDRRLPGETVRASSALVVVSDGERLTAIDRHRGDLIAEATFPEGNVTVAGGTVGVLRDQELTSWVPRVGQPSLHLPGSDGSAVPVAEGFVVGAASTDEPISRLVFGGKLVWSGDAFPILAVDAAEQGRTLLAREPGGTLIAVDILTGEERWTVDDVAVPDESVSVADGVVYATLVDYRADTTTLGAFDLLDGSLLWEHPLDESDSLAELVAFDAGVIVIDGDTLAAYRIAGA